MNSRLTSEMNDVREDKRVKELYHILADVSVIVTDEIAGYRAASCRTNCPVIK